MIHTRSHYNGSEITIICEITKLGTKASGSCHRKPLAESRAHRVQHKVWDLNTPHLVVNVSQSYSVQLFHSHSLWKPKQLCLSWQTVRFLRAINNDLPSNRGIKFKPCFYFFPFFYLLVSLSLFISLLSCLINTAATVHLRVCWKVQKQLKWGSSLLGMCNVTSLLLLSKAMNHLSSNLLCPKEPAVAPLCLI